MTRKPPLVMDAGEKSYHYFVTTRENRPAGECTGSMPGGRRGALAARRGRGIFLLAATPVFVVPSA